MVSDVLHQSWDALESPTRAFTRPGLQLETARQPGARVQKDHCSRPGQEGRALKAAQGLAAADCRDKRVQKRAENGD